MVPQKIYPQYWLIYAIFRSFCLLLNLRVISRIDKARTLHVGFYLEKIRQSETSRFWKQTCSHHKNWILKRKKQILVFRLRSVS